MNAIVISGLLDCCFRLFVQFAYQLFELHQYKKQSDFSFKLYTQLIRKYSTQFEQTCPTAKPANIELVKLFWIFNPIPIKRNKRTTCIQLKLQMKSISMIIYIKPSFRSAALVIQIQFAEQCLKVKTNCECITVRWSSGKTILMLHRNSETTKFNKGSQLTCSKLDLRRKNNWAPYDNECETEIKNLLRSSQLDVFTKISSNNCKYGWTENVSPVFFSLDIFFG